MRLEEEIDQDRQALRQIKEIEEHIDDYNECPMCGSKIKHEDGIIKCIECFWWMEPGAPLHESASE